MQCLLGKKEKKKEKYEHTYVSLSLFQLKRKKNWATFQHSQAHQIKCEGWILQSKPRLASRKKNKTSETKNKAPYLESSCFPTAKTDF